MSLVPTNFLLNSYNKYVKKIDFRHYNIWWWTNTNYWFYKLYSLIVREVYTYCILLDYLCTYLQQALSAFEKNLSIFLENSEFLGQNRCTHWITLFVLFIIFWNIKYLFNKRSRYIWFGPDNFLLPTSKI